MIVGGAMQENNTNKTEKKKYVFGEIKEYDLEKIEQEVLKESVYLDVFAGSDLNFKSNCVKLNGDEVSTRINQINTYSFNYKTSEFPDYHFSEGAQFGVMAQDLEKIFPELVKVDNNGNRLVNYTQMIPLMLESLKYLSNRVTELESKINK
jgi:hypothetical protein